MKNKIAVLLGLALLAVQTVKAQFLAPSNAPPSVELGWVENPSAGVTNYNIYQGTNSGQYMLKYAAATNLTFIVTNLTRGQTVFFNITAVANGLESSFGGEMSYTPPLPPPAPSFVPIIILHVENSPSISPGDWTEIESLAVSEDEANGFFRTALALSP